MQKDHFKIDGPAVISFSGGRTSGLMLRRCLDAGLQPDVHVLFANTGKERPETLDFVRDCGLNWGVQIHWLEFRREPDAKRSGYAEVTYETASRGGEPFERLIQIRKYLPNPLMRFCTTELKIRLFKRWMLDRGYQSWTNVVGIRADEERRARRIIEQESKERWEVSLPLYHAGVTQADVQAFWASQPFDLRIQGYQGNCDLCFLKGRETRLKIIRENPELSAWWIRMEQETSQPFRAHSMNYRELADHARRNPTLFDLLKSQEDGIIDCMCGE